MREAECKEKAESAHLIKFIEEASSPYAFSAEFVEIGECWVKCIVVAELLLCFL